MSLKDRVPIVGTPKRGEITPGSLAIPRPDVYRATVGPIFSEFLGLYGGYKAYNAANVLSDLKPPYIVVPRHLSNLDSLVVANMVLRTNGGMVSFMAKDKIWDIPVIGDRLGRFIGACGAFPVDRPKGFVKELEEIVAQKVDNEAILGIFAERQRRKGDYPERRNMKSGAAYFAIKHGSQEDGSLPIVPVGLIGTEPGNRGHVTAYVAEPITLPFMELPDPQETPMAFARAMQPFTNTLFEGLHDAQKEAIHYREEWHEAA